MELIFEACHRYGWTVQEVLEMPYNHFISALKHGRRWAARSRVEDIDVAAVGICNREYATKLRQSYTDIFDYEDVKRYRSATIQEPMASNLDVAKVLRGIKRG